MKSSAAGHRRRLVLCSLLVSVGGAAVAVPDQSAAAGTHGATPAAARAAVGASLPFTGYEAEDAATNGTIIGPDRTKGTLASEVSHTYVRNSGDDGLAMWSENHADHDNTFSANTVVLPMLANGIAVYGGRDNAVTGNYVADVVTDGGGLHVANRFAAVPLTGTTTLARNTVVRTGGIWFYAADSSMNGTVNVSDSDFIDVSDAIGAYGFGPSVNNLNFTDIRIHGASGFVLAIHSNGSATFSNVVATNAAGSVYNCGSAFTINFGAGNSGRSTGSTCGPPSGQHVGPITGIGGKCVDISGGNSGAGTAVQLYTCNGTAAQQWTLP